MLWFIYTLVFLAGLVQTPILVDLLRFVFPEWKIKRLTNRAANVLLVTLMTTFFCLGLGYQIYFFIRLLPEVPLRSAKLICHSVVAYWLWANMIFNYFFAVFVHPGEEVITSKKQPEIGRGEKVGIYGKLKVVEHLINKEEPEALSDLCRKEVELSSEQTPQHGMEWNTKQSHYCKVCQAMVLYMDHHCPFTGNCVGIRNYVYFFLCLVYGTVGVGYGITVALFYFGDCILPNVWWYLGLASSDGDWKEVCTEIEPHSNLFIPVLGGFVVATTVLIFQVFLLLSDLSTYDVLKNYRKLPVLRFAWQRIQGGKCREPNSRLNVLLLRQRKSVLWFLFPVRNAIQ